MDENSISFQSPAELEAILDQIGLMLHAKNRTSGGESVYYWLLAETIRKAGRLASLAETDAATFESFGGGYRSGDIPENQKEQRFLELLKNQRT